MRRIINSRLFRCLVCLLVLCSLIVNISPINVQAASIAGGITIEGLLALGYAISGGMVFTGLTVDQINNLGTDLDDTITVTVDTETLGKYQRLKEYGEKIQPDPPEDPEEWHSLLKQCLAGGLLSAITGWVASYVAAAKKGAEIPEGYAMYNGVVLPELPEFSCYGSTPYMLLTKSNNYYYLYVTDVAWTAMVDTTWGVGAFHMNGPCHYDVYRSMSSSSAWSQQSCKDVTTESTNGWVNVSFVWANFDLWNEDTQSVELPGTEVVLSNADTIPVIPSIYVGDIPDQIESGEKDENNLELPIIDPFGMIRSGNTALDDINNLEQQLYDGDISYQDYIDKVTVQDGSPEPDPNPEPDPGGSDPSDPSDSVVDPSPFFLVGISKFFPFCIPFDLYDFFACLNAEPEAPKFHWEFKDLSGTPYSIDIDLTPWDSLARLFRMLQLFLFVTGLATATRKYIKW